MKHQEYTLTHRVCNLDDETAAIANNDALERRRVHHRDATRDLVIVALDRVLDDGFTYGPWFDEPGPDEQCVLVSPTRSFTLYAGDPYDDLIGRNDQGVLVHYDVDELLDNDKLVEEMREPLVFGCA